MSSFSRKNQGLSEITSWNWDFSWLLHLYPLNIGRQPKAVHPQTKRHFLRSLSTYAQGITLRIHDGSNVRIMVGAGQILTSTVEPQSQGAQTGHFGACCSMMGEQKKGKHGAESQFCSKKRYINPAETPMSMLHPNRLRRKSSRNLFSSSEKGSVKPQSTTPQGLGDRPIWAITLVLRTKQEQI